MKIVKIKDLEGTSRKIEFQYGGFLSYRVVIKKDKMGFGICKTIVPKCEPQLWHYENHLEACYCIEGKGQIVNLETGEKFDIDVDTTYILDKNDKHTFQALSDRVVLISVFNPPLNGNETHKDGGSYE